MAHSGEEVALCTGCKLWRKKRQTVQWILIIPKNSFNHTGSDLERPRRSCWWMAANRTGNGLSEISSKFNVHHLYPIKELLHLNTTRSFEPPTNHSSPFFVAALILYLSYRVNLTGGAFRTFLIHTSFGIYKLSRLFL